ncbi:hypothetical protein J7T55_014743 [Diaporthe amygdali]|uniref:uncharacterized protein n=1 Tax=Phomopsis amygdali TaxID=1214568 RepID=UPI0022FE4528|nr:uncharacterized protein J7T55_014743 [Diaporthe amygdali]KAJ0109941.1 hypothetical protein J7T55_014743 [Diaporthe amygdali]
MSGPHKVMSMEAALEEERREVEALIAARNRPRPPSALSGVRSSSPFTPRSPVRSMLDIGPMKSMLDVDSPPAGPVRSMLDMDSPPTSASAGKQVFSTPSSPVLASNQLARAANSSHPRHMSDAAARPVGFGPRSDGNRDLTSEYQFSDIITSNTGHAALPKRVTQGNKKVPQPPSAMSHIVRGSDVSRIPLPGDTRGRHSIAGPGMRLGSKSRSPHSRLGIRSSSPAPNLLSGRHLSPAGRAFVEETYGVDMSNAYRRLSDANLLRSGGTLAEIGRKKKSEEHTDGGRLAKDYFSPDGDDLFDDSSDDNDSNAEEGDRGRKAARSFEDSDKAGAKADKDRTALSLLAAAEEERIEVAKNPHVKYQYRSLLDEPQITVTGPAGQSERTKSSKASSIHPATSFDDGPPSGARTPMDSDTEADLTDIRRAQKLSLFQTPIKDTPNAARALRIIYRGDWRKVAQEAKEEQRTLRKYIVASDLSDEATHALEWAVGTVLRDGDTMICLYCVDEEAGIAPADDAKSIKDQGAALNVVADSKAPVTPGGSALEVHKADQSSESLATPIKSKAEEERHRAVQDITDRVERLLRKTKLQVRVIVEVLHCKNPKHQILEIIDVVNPTLVVLGSRGQSALKGVILGSFSNYLVTKSSVPVMVARKKLRKQSKYKKLSMNQVNNISSPMARTLANAKVD